MNRKDGKIVKCCIFNKSENEFKENKDFEVMKKYPEVDSPNECKRKLMRCNKCGALFLYQFLDWNDSYYDDFIQVDSEEQADKLNEKLSFSTFSCSDKPMIKIGSDNKVKYILPSDKEEKMEDREKLIVETLKEKGREGLKELNVSNEEIDKIVANIDKKIGQLNLEQTLVVSKELDYNLPIDYCVYYAKQINLHIKPNLFKVDGKEKMIQTLLSMDTDSKVFILNYQEIDSQYNGQIVPFALLEFGDNLCFNKSDNSIVYYEHENDTIEKVADKWDEFVKNLYE